MFFLRGGFGITYVRLVQIRTIPVQGAEHVRYPGTKTVPSQNMFGTQEPNQYWRRTCSVPRNQNSTNAERVQYPGTKQYRRRTCSVPRNKNSTNAECVQYPGTKQYRRRTCSVPRNKKSTGAEHVQYPGTKTVPAQNMFGTQ